MDFFPNLSHLGIEMNNLFIHVQVDPNGIDFYYRQYIYHFLINVNTVSRNLDHLFGIHTYMCYIHLIKRNTKIKFKLLIK